jgi:Cu/Ag efflux protein CusF
MKLTKISIALSLAALVSFSAFAQETHSEQHKDIQTQAVSDDMTAATVRKLDLDNGKITLKHEAIKSLGMPGMTMVFQIEDGALFEGLAQGDSVRFKVEKKGTAFIITAIEKM